MSKNIEKYNKNIDFFGIKNIIRFGNMALQNNKPQEMALRNAQKCSAEELRNQQQLALQKSTIMLPQMQAGSEEEPARALQKSYSEDIESNAAV